MLAISFLIAFFIVLVDYGYPNMRCVNDIIGKGNKRRTYNYFWRRKMKALKVLQRFTCIICALLMVITLIPIMPAKAATQITITYDAGTDATINGGTVYKVSATAGVSTKITTVKPVRPGCNFLGWTRTKGSGQISFYAGMYGTFSKNTTFWPVWNANIAYAAGDGKYPSGAVVMNISVTLGVPATIPSTVPSRTGYTFEGWTTVKGSSTVVYKPNTTVTFTAPATLWPVWKSTSNKVTITYATNVGTITSSKTQTVTKGQSVTLKPPTITNTDGYTFQYYTDSKSNKYYPDKKTYSFNSNITLTAVWERDTYTIIYHWLNGYGFMPNHPDKTETVKNIPVNQDYCLKNLTGKEAYFADGSVVIGWQRKNPYEKNIKNAPLYQLGQKIPANTFKKGDVIEISPVIRNTYSVKYNLVTPNSSPDASKVNAFKKSYDISRVRSDRTITTAPISSIPITYPNAEIVGYSTVIHTKAGNNLEVSNVIIDAGKSVNLVDACGINWDDRINVARFPTNHVINGSIFDSMGYRMGTYSPSESSRTPYHVEIELVPIIKRKGSDAIVSNKGGIYEGKVTTDLKLLDHYSGHERKTITQTVDFFLTRDQLVTLSDQVLTPYLKDNFWKFKGSDKLNFATALLTGLGIVAALCALAVSAGGVPALSIIDIMGSAKWGATVTFSSFFVAIAAKSAGNGEFIDKFLKELGKQGIYTSDENDMRGVHFSAKITSTWESGANTTGLVYKSTKVELLKLEPYDSIVLYHFDETGNDGKWMSADVAKQIEGIFK